MPDEIIKNKLLSLEMQIAECESNAVGHIDNKEMCFLKPVR